MQSTNHHNSQQAQAPSVPEFYDASQPPLESPSLNITQNPTDISSDHALPPYDLLYALVDLYFKYVNTCKLILSSDNISSEFLQALSLKFDSVI
jgi:hypothetical protein